MIAPDNPTLVQTQYMAQAASYVKKADGIIDSLKGKMGGRFDGMINTADGFIDHAAGFLGVEVTPATGSTPADGTTAPTTTTTDPPAAAGYTPPTH